MRLHPIPLLPLLLLALGSGAPATSPAQASPRAAAESAAGAPVLVSTGSRHDVRVFAGVSRGPELMPEFDRFVRRDADGTWQAPSRLPFPRPGLPLLHRGMTWILEERATESGATFHALLPVSGEGTQPGVRLEHVQGGRGAVVAHVDEWTFVIAELGPSAQIIARVVESQGSTFEMRFLREEFWPAAWPPDGRLLAAGLHDGVLVVMGLAGEHVLVEAGDGSARASLPPVDITGADRVAACVTDRGPVVILLHGNRLSAHRHDGQHWEAIAPLTLPDSVPPVALAATTFGRERTDVHVAALGPSPRPHVMGVLLQDGAWGSVQRVNLGTDQAPVAAIRPSRPTPDLDSVERRASQLRWLRWGLVLVAFSIVALLLRHLARLR